MSPPDAESQEKPLRRVVYDTGVVLQAALNPDGPAARALTLLESGVVAAFISPRLRSEYENVLERPAIREKYLRLTDERIATTLERIDRLATMIFPNPPVYINFPRDPNDEHIINLSIHVQADYLVTRDNDLLDLSGREPLKTVSPPTLVVEPVTLLREIEGRG